jgi:feruloyl esterase
MKCAAIEGKGLVLRGLQVAGGTALLISMMTSRETAAQTATACERLASLTLPGVAITKAEVIDSGTFAPPGRRGGSAEPYKDLAAFCRVTTTAASAGSDVKSEIWLPLHGWNRDFQPAGSGYWGGSIPYGRMREILLDGFATAGTNLGIEGAAGPSFAIDHPEKLTNLGNAPFHIMVDQAKALIAAHYGTPPRWTLMNECGGGGSRDVLGDVQRWPGDLDIAAAVGFTNWGTHHGLAQMWLYWATHKDEASFIPSNKYAAIHEAALAACDAKDGVKDGVIEDPPHCKFDPAVLLCKDADGPACLTAPQVEAVRTIYATPRHARTQQPLYGPMVPGSELSWEDMTARPRPYGYAESFYRFLVFRDPKWDYKTFRPDFESDVDRADTPQNLAINATNPDIGAFVGRGGKLLLMGGWNDDLGPGNNVTYYEQVVRTLGETKARDAVRLFMVPGMHHCLGLDYPSTYTVSFDVVGALRQWKTTGKAPDEVIVTTRKGQSPRQRLVCAYPKIAQYRGTGNVDDRRSFSCVSP